MSSKAIVVLVVAVIASAAQFYAPTMLDNPPVSRELTAPTEVRRVLRRSCYDCHSNETRWPWYSHVAPASWLLSSDVREARARMNFSSWPQAVSPAVDCYFIRRIGQRAQNGEMPPLRYRVLHPSAAVTKEDAEALLKWAANRCGADS